MIRTILTLTLFFVAFSALAQDDLAEIKLRYPDENAVYLQNNSFLEILVDGDSLRIVNTVDEEILHLKDHSEFYGNKKVYGSHFSQISKIEAKTLIREKNKYRVEKVTDYKKNSNAGGSVFYDDSYFYAFDFPAVAANNRTQLHYEVSYKDSRILPVHFFEGFVPSVSSSFIIKAPADVELFFKLLNDDKNIIQFSKTQKGKFVFYEWKGRNLSDMKVEAGSPDLSYYTPQLVYFIKSYQGISKRHEVLSDLTALHNWYRSFVNHLNKNPSPDLQTTVAQLKQESTSELDLVKKIFYWAQDKVEYIAFEEGMRGFVPHEASYTFDKRYGDCKDMANLIVAMLELAGIKSYHTWIGSRDLPYKYSEFCSPIVDNHMIATYIAPTGQYYFLDATSDYTPFGFPSSMIQGKEAFISKDASTFEVRQIPILKKEENVMRDSMSLHLVNNEIVGKGKTSLTGFPKTFSSAELDRAGTNDIKRFVATLIGKGSNKFFLDQFKLSELHNQDKPVEVFYDFRISDYFQKSGNEIYLNLNLSKDYFNYFINPETRKTPLEIDYTYLKEEVIVLTIPEGFELEYVPEDYSYSGKFIGCKLLYDRGVNGKIILKKQFYLDSILITPADFQSWNDDIRNVSTNYKEAIILKRKS
ncbi:MAG TPA: transglutaminase-like domain-containing protein [Chryseosolibacter sp.]